MPIASANEPQPGILKSGRIIGSNNIPKILINPDLLSSCDATKNGNKEGNTTLSQRLMPFEADATTVFGYTIRAIINSTANIGTINFFR